MINPQSSQKMSVLNSAEGFTFIELLISVAIFAIGILAVASVQLGSMNSDTHSRLLTDAYKVATDQVEDIIRWNYHDARLDENDATTPFHTDLTTSKGLGDRFQVTYVVVEDPDVNIKTITVTVEIPSSTLDPVVIEFVKAEIQDLVS